MTTVLEKIARQLMSRTSFSALATKRAEDAIVDTIGCMIAGMNDASPRSIATTFANEIKRDGPSLVFTGGRASRSVAALINGTAAHCLDFDDNFHPARAHASAVLVPALLSIATSSDDFSGPMLVKAYLAGLEAQASVGFGVIPSHYNRGWHGTSTIGCIGAAAGVAVLLGLDEPQIANAMSLATSMASGPKGQFGTGAKPFHAGIAARNAVEAALLAQSGLTGRLDILERPQGFLDLFGGDEATGWTNLSWDEKHIIETRGLVTKLHPCCASTHRAIDAALDLQKEHGFSIEDIQRIDTKVGRSAVDNLAYPDPSNEMQARFSMQYCLAVALTNGGLSLGDFTPQAAIRPELRCLMAKINMTSYSVEEERGVERLPHQVHISLKDGRRFSTERLHANGSIAAPSNDGQKLAKFEDCLRWAGLSTAHITHSDLKAICSGKSVRAITDNALQVLNRHFRR
ncbi:MmgE/PrpD family protein [Rhizobium oryziradicis]|uniref:2-methylcitrate dehydratase n=1 Tax=Rhizobium oryziradicis TaxID=1867956 RepID=A0A1Q8ZUT1_9HYPH|nr:MmgE/PrpD family protein [Rhizobium oryziradicis]OLP45747.1 2-methylcitrate dehydratase [Rhizobium oryziradicis]